jgi:DNA repair exonuclease SbcCD ATPase subunit
VLAELDALAEEVEAVRAETSRLDERRAALPRELAAARATREEAEAAVAERSDTHAAAVAALADAESRGDEARVATARRDEVRARDFLRSAERRLERARAEEERLAEEEAEIERAAQEVAARARALASDVGRRSGVADVASPPPDAGPAELGAWATETRAALFVARGRLAAEREAVIRQANELGALLLGEPLPAQSAAQVARRVEQRRPA